MRKLFFNPVSGLASIVGCYFILQHLWRPMTATGVWGFLIVLGIVATVVMFAVALNTEKPTYAGGLTPTGFAGAIGLMLFFPTMIAVSGAVGFVVVFIASIDLVLKIASASIAGVALWGMVFLSRV